MASIKMILDKRKVKLDGSYPICFLICQNRKITTRSSKIYVLEREWNNYLKSIKKSNPQHKLLNVKLKKAYADIQSQLLLADDEKVKEFLAPVIQIKATLPVKKTVYKFAQDLIDQLKMRNSMFF